ncbi:hypothetical protein [Paenibacillus ginsengihumi]|uniref:hypothetical protein n=1 Tax=Paenibacillus ginsengihumi TaxID=431596 RepID=UPI001FDEB76C|nr:hypothetical protein [Paenibacillus ginsengihumi]
MQQFRGDWLQIREYRPNCCTFYNIEPQIGVLPPFLLYKIQHLLTNLKIAPGSRHIFILLMVPRKVHRRQSRSVDFKI